MTFQPARRNLAADGRQAGHAARRVASVTWSISVALVALCLWLALRNHLTLTRFFAEYVVALAAATLAFATVGLLIASRRPENRIGWLFCATGIGNGVCICLQQYARYALVTRPGSLPGGLFAAWLNFWLWIPVEAICVIWLPLLFPDGYLPSRHWRLAAWGAGVGAALLAASLALQAGPIDASLLEVANPMAPVGAEQLSRLLTALAAPWMLAALVAAAAAPLVRLRHAQGIERQQLKWFAYGAIVLIAAFLIPILAQPNFTNDTLLSGVLLALAFSFLAVTVGIAILKYRLYDIDVIIRRTLIYGLLTGLLVVVYLACVLVLQALLRALTGQGSDLSAILSTLAIAGLFSPLRRRVQHGIDRRFYRRRYNAESVLAAFAPSIRAEVDLDRLATALLDVTQEALQPAQASLWLRRRISEADPSESGSGRRG